jgi:hypothetical protein
MTMLGKAPGICIALHSIAGRVNCRNHHSTQDPRPNDPKLARVLAPVLVPGVIRVAFQNRERAVDLLQQNDSR